MASARARAALDARESCRRAVEDREAALGAAYGEPRAARNFAARRRALAALKKDGSAADGRVRRRGGKRRLPRAATCARSCL